ncbi:MAG: hypothetical protein JXR25_09535 [Pontiellaceae bacterium]|nr:hypothetical protein [Pontiellaceae bacterium]MBN2785058.1 hypothetical protein [Pontiellaceae bacterium]
MDLGRKLLLIGLVAGCAATVFAASVEPAGKTEQYYRILEKRPRPGYLFERFCNSWLEEHEMQELETFLESRKDDSTGSLLLAFYYDRTGRPVQAMDMCGRALELAPDEMTPHYYRALFAVRLGQYDDAVADLETVAAQKGELWSDAMKLLARTYIRLDRVDDGLKLLSSLLLEEEGDTDLQDEIIELKIEEGLYEEALKDCSELMVSSKNAQYRMMLALRKASILTRLDRTEPALETLDQALNSAASGSWIEREVLRRIAQTYRLQQNLTGLKDHYARLLESHPGNLLLLRSLTSVSVELNDHDAAVVQGRALLRLAPQDEEIREFYVKLLEECGRHEEAIDLVRVMLDQQPDRNELRLRLAGLYGALNHSDQVRELVLEYLEHSPKEVFDYFRAARSLVHLGEANDATQVYLQCLEAYPESLEAREELVYHMIREGMYHLAAKHLDALQLQGDESMLLRVANLLCGAHRGMLAYDFLKGRMADFGRSPRYMEGVYQTLLAVPEDERPDGGPLAMQWMQVSATLDQMHRAAFAVLDEARRAGRMNELRADLEAETVVTLPELYLLTRVYVKQGDLDLAWKAIDGALARDPASELLLEMRLEQAESVHDRARTVECLQRLRNAAPKRGTIWIKQLADLMFESEQYDDALALLQQWKQLSSSNPQIYLRESRILLAQDKNEEAVTLLRRAAYRLPEAPELKERLAEVYIDQGRLLEAEQVHWSLVDGQEDLDGRLTAFNRMLELLRWTDRMDAVMEELKERASANRADVFPLLALAECHALFDDYDARTEALLKVLELRPNDTQTMRVVARAELASGSYDQALALIRQVAREEKDPRTLLDMARLLILRGDQERGLRMIREECRFDDPDILLEAAETLLGFNAYEDVEQLLADRLDDFAGDYRISYLYAVALEESGMPLPAVDLFLRLLSVREERAGVAPMTLQSEAGEWLPLDELPSMNQLMTIMEFEQQAYSYRQNMRSRNMGADFGPRHLCELVPFAVNHLRKLLPMLEPDARERVTLAMEQADLAYIDILLAEDVDYFSSSPDWWFECIDAHSGDMELAYLLAVIAVSESGDYNGFLSEEQRDRLYTMLQDEFPGGALCALLSAGPPGDDQWTLLPDLLVRCSDSEQALQSTQMAIGKLYELASENEMSEELKSAFMAYALSLPETALNQRYEMLQELKAYEVLIDDMETRYREEMQKSAYSRYKRSSGYPSGDNWIKSISFPPDVLLPSWSYRFRYSSDEDLTAALKSIEDPVLRLSLLYRELDHDETASLIETIEQGAEAGFDKNLLLGTWYASGQDDNRAFSYLIRARHAAPTTELRRRIDGALLDRATYMDTLDAEQQRECRAAVLRLSSLYLSGKDSVIMDDLRRKLGMAEKPVARPKAAMAGTPGTQRGPTDLERMGRMIAQGNLERVFRESGAILRRSLVYRTMLESYEQVPEELTECMELLRKNGLEDRFVEFMRPESDESTQSVMAYALACELTDRKEEALEHYQAVLKAHSGWSGVRFCVITLMEDEPESALEIMNEMPVSMLQNLIFTLCSDIDQVSLETRVHYTELMLAAIDATREHAEPFALMYVMEHIVDPWNNGNADYAPLESGLLSPVSADEKNESAEPPAERIIAIQQRRNEQFVRLCDLFLTNPRMGRIGFSMMEQYCRIHKIQRDDLEELAEQILLQQKKGYYADEDDLYDHTFAIRTTPERYFASVCMRSNDRARFDRVMAAVQDRRLHDEMEALAPLFFADEDVFRELLSACLTKDNLLSSGQKNLERILSTYRDRNETIDLTPLILESIHLDDRDSLRLRNELLQKWFELCLDMERPEAIAPAALEFAETLFSDEDIAIIGNPETTPEKIELIFSDTVYVRLNLIFGILDNSQMDVSSWNRIVERMAPVFRHFSRGSSGMDRFWRNRDEVTTDLLLETVFVEDWNRFSSYSFDQESSLLVMLLGHLSSDKTLRSEVAGIAPPTYGSRLIEILLSHQELSPEEMVSELAQLAGDYYPEIMASEQSKREDLFNLWGILQDKYGWDADPSLVPEGPARKLFSLWADRQAEDLKSDAAALLSERSIEQAEQIYSIRERAGKLARKLAYCDPATAVCLIDRIQESAGLARQIKNSPSRYYENLADQTFDSITDGDYPGRSTLKLLLDYAYRHDLAGGWKSLNDLMESDVIRPAIKRRVKRAEAAGHSVKEARVYAVQEGIQLLDELTAGYGCPPIVDALEYLINEECMDRDQLARWLDSEEGLRLTHHDLYQLLLSEETGPAHTQAWIDQLTNGAVCSAVRGIFTLALYEMFPSLEILREQAVVDAAFNEVKNLEPELYLTTSGFERLIWYRPAELDAKALYDDWLETTRNYTQSASRRSEIALALADLLIDSGRQPEAGMVLMTCGEKNMSSVVLWSRIHNVGEMIDSLQRVLSDLDRSYNTVGQSHYVWSAEDAEWFYQQVSAWEGDEGRFVRMAASSIPVEGEEVDLASFRKEFLEHPFEEPEVGLVLLDMMLPRVTSGSLDSILIDVYTDDLLEKFIEDAHGAELRRVEEYARMLVRTANHERMANLLRLHEKQNSDPGCSHEVEMRSVVLRCAGELGMTPEPEE